MAIEGTIRGIPTPNLATVSTAMVDTMMDMATDRFTAAMKTTMIMGMVALVITKDTVVLAMVTMATEV